MAVRVTRRELLAGATALAASSVAGADPGATGWEGVRSLKMAGDLRAFWNVTPAGVNQAEALRRGFRPVNLVGDYADYAGKQRRNINNDLKTHPDNPWKKPPYFREIVEQNIRRILAAPDAVRDQAAIFVHDIEFPFEQDVAKAWANPDVRRDSGAATLSAFRRAYLREWATWFSLPCRWSKAMLPKQPVGIYGPQPFRRDYWGIAGKTAQQIDGTHVLDGELWRHIDPFVDFYVASIYVFYDDPGSVFYMAANVEENYRRTRQYGAKPVYAYEWLRYHDSNAKLKGHELAPWLAEAAAVVPYFSGARGVVLWGWEPKATRQPYARLPLFMKSLGRVADLSEKIARGTLLLDPPAAALWKKKAPLVRRLKVSDAEWILLGVNPWQSLTATSRVSVRCGARQVSLTLRGRHTDLFHVTKAGVRRLAAA